VPKSNLWLCGGLLVLAALLGGCDQQRLTITKPEDATHARIGVMTGSVGEALAAARFPEAQIKSFDDIMDAVAAMQSGQLDTVITGYPTALQVSKKNPGLMPLPDHLTDEDTAIALRKDSAHLLAEVNAILKEFRADGTLASLDRRWFKPDLSPYEELVIDLPARGEPLRVGVSATREPFSFVDKDGRVTGHDGELARLIAARLGRPLEFSNMKFMALIPALQSRKVDLIITGMTATPERRKVVDFSTPYYANAQILLVAKVATGSAPVAQIRSPADFAGKRVAVLLGSAHEAWMRDHHPEAELLEFQNAADVVLAVTSGKADGGLMDAEPLKEILAANPALAGMQPALFSFPVAVGFAREQEDLRDAFNVFLAALKADGTYQEMLGRWMERKETALPEIPVSAEAAPLVLGTTDVGLPFAAVVDNRMVGFDIELAQRFAASQGLRLEISSMEFASMIAAVAAGKVDMISSSIYVTEERKKQILFGDPYFEMGTQFFATKTTLGMAGATAAGTKEESLVARTVAGFRNNILLENRYLLIWDGLKTTVVISIFSTLMGTVLGGLVCFMRMSSNGVLNLAARTYINLIRGMPVLVLLMLIFYVVFASVSINPVLVAVIAFGMNFGAYSAEIFRAGIESIDSGQSEAGIAMGFTPVQTFRFIVLPQTVRRILPVYRGEFISLVKMTSIVGYIAVQDLTKASDIIRSRTFDAFFPLVMVAILYFLISWVLMLGLEYLESRTDPKRRRRGARA
jgi:polar amino acid transport system substrate-binding protein